MIDIESYGNAAKFVKFKFPNFRVVNAETNETFCDALLGLDELPTVPGYVVVNYTRCSFYNKTFVDGTYAGARLVFMINGQGELILFNVCIIIFNNCTYNIYFVIYFIFGNEFFF